jgi:Uncharacterized component of anaerobic dehydrogenases
LDSFAAAFSTLAALHLQPPREDVLDTVRSMAPEWPLGSEGLSGRGISELTRSMALGETTSDIARDHDRLYGDSAAAVCAPYESVHRGTEGLVFDEETLQVRSSYRELGLQAPRLNREPDDHIGLELEFLAHTCLRSLDALEAGDLGNAALAQQHGARFLDEHLRQWAPDFLDQVADAAATEFMRALAHLTGAALVEYRTALGTDPTVAVGSGNRV